MKAFKVCPGCQGPFRRISHNSSWLEELCDHRCALDFSQFHRTSFEDDDIIYQNFNTQDFFLYAYFDFAGYKNEIYIYHKIFPRGEATQNAAFKIPMFDIDFSKVDEYNKRWKLWAILS